MKGYTKIIVDGTYKESLFPERGIQTLVAKLLDSTMLVMYICGEKGATFAIAYSENGKIQSLFNGEDVKIESSGKVIRLS